MATTPWGPRVGDRVRVHLRRGRTCDEAPHFASEGGRTGRVIRDVPLPDLPSHPYLVMLEPPQDGGELDGWAATMPARHYAADELEPLDA
jgi:hypothetical protein